MLNQVVLVGRIKEIEYGKLIIAISRSYKNSDGEYVTDFVPVYLDGAVADRTQEYCSVGDVVGIKGRIQNGVTQDIVIIVEKLTFLTSNCDKREDENNEI